MTRAQLDRALELGRREDGLAVVALVRVDGSIHASVVNAGVLVHPVTGERIVGFVARGGTRKLEILRVRRRATVVFRSGWEWVAVDGAADLVGHNDDLDGLEPEGVLPLIREVYAAAAGGTAAEWPALDEAITAEGHTAVLIRPTRVYSRAGGL